MLRINWLLATGAIAYALALGTARADTLLVVSSSGGMFGDAGLNAAMENFGAKLVSGALGSQYRAVYIWRATDGTSVDSFARAAVRAQQPDEPMDVFALEHTDPSFLPGMAQEDVEKIFPFGMIRHLFSSGCSNWGDFTADPDGKNPKFTKGTFSDHMVRLGVQEYVIHANLNATGPLSYPLLAGELRHGGSWIDAGKRAFDEEDHLSAIEYPLLKPLDWPLKSLSSLISLPFVGSVHAGMVEFFGSRPVFGGLAFKPRAGLFAGRNMLDGQPGEQNEAMLAPAPELARVLSKDFPGVFGTPAPSAPDGEPTSQPDPSVGEPAGTPPFENLGDGLVGLADLIRRLAETYSGGSTGCLEPAAVQSFADTYFKTADGRSPKFLSFCIVPTSSGDTEIKWTLSPTGRKHFPGLDVWLVKLPGNFAGSGISIRSLFLRRHGSITISEGKVKIWGIGIRAEGPRISAKFKVPDGVMHFALRGVDFKSDGRFSVRIGTELGVFRAEGHISSESGVALDDVRVLGIPIKLKK
jgi:hypothetical protein